MPEEFPVSAAQQWWSPETFKSLGLPTVLCCAFMWIGKGEIDKASARYDKLSDIMTTSTVKALECVAASINNSTHAVRQGSVCINNNTEALKAAVESMEDRKHGTASIPPVPNDGI